jgi:hypothetical protein
LVVIVTPATSVSFFRPEFDEFLFAPIGVERNEMALSVLSALARLGVDPWEEAAELSELPKNTAVQRLASLIARLPVGRWAQADSRAIADRLIELLPRRNHSQVPLAEKAYGLRGLANSTGAKILICALLLAVALIVATTREPPSQTNPADAPPVGTTSPSQTLFPISR